ncbi:uncharacterized protein ASPGLDRAFT_40000 [Aspergillus glaucus CBS 516.65]|uniref:Uncharacterized protein n=1 Tax=Aspergillus glaucus CBS 516.65 TaxID=1160497 RepID=A0A1L9V5S7_ASPGL|nr:hypothetical protein ASPGLDRAFT_40000 [Aspergillus glaucus CBS 516.65]OJJ79297.1 hypothetical protein ASPGLDRAFT_40000 [Aspergillus glaucus CBS 516.65]
MVNTTFFLAFTLLFSSIFAAPLEVRGKGKATAVAPKPIFCLNVVKSRLENTLDVNKIKDQIKDIPKEKCVGSCYPHVYGDNTNFREQGLLDPHCNGKQMLEYPVFKDGKYDYESNKKQRGRPGPFRALFTQNEGYYCGTISHDGTLENKSKGIMINESAGGFHVCSYDNVKEEYEKRVREAKGENDGKKKGKEGESSKPAKGKGGK